MSEAPRARTQPRSRGTQQSRKSRVSPARLVAYEVLSDVSERDGYANLALAARVRAAQLNTRDAAFATELSSGALRGRGRYDRIIELAAQRSIAEIDQRTVNVLRLGVHQILAMRTAVHAAVHESVELQRVVARQGGAGFVNGVLRAVTRKTPEEWDAALTESAPSADAALALTQSHPLWVLRALRDALRSEGREHELEATLRQNNQPPRVSLALLPTTDAPTLAQLTREQPRLLAEGPSPVGVVLSGGDPAHTIASLQLPTGQLRVQDQGSQLAALALTRCTPVQPGERWLDLCAGPGGKTALLGAEAMRNGARLRANEVAPHRAQLVRHAVAAVHEVTSVVSYDGRDDAAFDSGDGSRIAYDRILVDAPCSGLGALRRRPEARWRKRPADLPELTALQSELLAAAARHLAEDGVIAYVTCSPHLAETRGTVDRFLRAHPEFCELDTRSVLNTFTREPLDFGGSIASAGTRTDDSNAVRGDSTATDPPGSVQLWPHRHGTDAMFIALLTRSRTVH